MKLTLKYALAAIFLVSSLTAIILVSRVSAPPVLNIDAPAAAPEEIAFAAMERGDDATVRRLFRALVVEGSAPSQLLFLDIIYDIGSMYHFGSERPQDYAEAANWYRLAADQGYALAQYSLGEMYFDGLGVPQDYAEAVRLFRFVADQGSISAQNNLGFMYENGLGVPQDYVLAHMWFNLSAAQGNEIALVDRDLIAQRMTPEQIAEAQRLAREWRPTTQPPQ